MVQFKVQLGITKSIAGGYDSFNVAFYDAADGFLSAILFDTSLDGYYIWTDNGEIVQDTGEQFLFDFIHQLSVTIDLASNRWSAELDGIGIFGNEAFTSQGDSALCVGGVAAEWEILDPIDPGDNWLLIDNWSLSALEDDAAPNESFRITEITSVGGDGLQFSWPSAACVLYQVKTSIDALDWIPQGNDLEGTASVATLSHSDFIALSTTSVRYYRVRWLGSPNDS